MGADLGRTLSHHHGWVIQTEAVDEMSDQDILSEAEFLEHEAER